jgi:plasmid stability protein
MRRLLPVLLGLVTVLGAHPAAAQEVCPVDDRSTKEVLPGVILTWDSSFRCENAPDEGTYRIRVRVSNHARSSEAVRIDDLILRRTTPRPRGQAPEATAEPQGLPITVKPGQTKSFAVSGAYELVKTDEGKKANLHLLALGEGKRSGKGFKLGINVHLRAPGATG